MPDLDVLARELARLGPPASFGVPGSGASLTLIDALVSAGVHFRTTQSESAAAIMAGTTGRLTGRVATAISIKGPGLANMVAGLAACHLEALPLLALSEAFPGDAPLSSAHKRMDHAALVAATVKGTRAVTNDENFAGSMLRWAGAERPGPVHVDLVDALEIQDAAPKIPGAQAHGGLLNLVAQSHRPVIIAGSYAARAGLSGWLNALSIPVFTTAGAKGAIDERLPHAAGVYTGVGGAYAPESVILPDADLVVGLGLRSGEVLAVPRFDVPVVNVDPLGAMLSPGYSLAATAGPEVLDELRKELAAKDWGQDEVVAAKSVMLTTLLEQPFLPAHVFRDVHRHFDGQARIVLDTGYFCTVGEHVWPASRWDWCLGSGQGRFMGIAVPIALAAAMCDRSVPTVLVTGDGGIGTFIGELRHAVRERLPLVCLFMSDGGFGSVRTRAIRDSLVQEPLLMPDDWCAVIEGMGFLTSRVWHESQLVDALNSWSRDSGPLFLHIDFDPDDYQRMTAGLR